MALTQEEEEQLQLYLDEFSSNEDRLTEWEKGFVHDMQERFEKYEQTLFVSGKQWKILTRIYEKVTRTRGDRAY